MSCVLFSRNDTSGINQAEINFRDKYVINISLHLILICLENNKWRNSPNIYHNKVHSEFLLFLDRTASQVGEPNLPTCNW